MRRTFFIFGIFAIVLIIFPESYDAVTFKLTNFICESYNQSWIVIHYCRLKVIQRNRIGAYYNSTIIHPVNDIWVKFQLFKWANGYKPWLVNLRFDGCRFLKKSYNPVAKLITGLFLDFTNFNHTCPYVGTQILNGLYLRPELVKVPMPTGDYKLAIGWYFDQKLQFETNASFTFVENLIDQ